MNETVVNGTLALVTWAVVGFLKWRAPAFWAKHSKLVKLGFIGLTASVLAVAAGATAGNDLFTIGQSAITAFMGAVFARNALKAAQAASKTQPEVEGPPAS